MRLFVAVRFTSPVENALLRALSALRKQGRGIFTRPENFHLTLAFLGETQELGRASAVLEGIPLPGPFPLSVGGPLGRFGDLWWAGIQAGPELGKLAYAVQGALREQGFPIERRRWQPHVTLIRQWRGLPPDIVVPNASMTVSRVSLMESRREAGRLIYEERWGRTL